MTKILLALILSINGFSGVILNKSNSDQIALTILDNQNILEVLLSDSKETTTTHLKLDIETIEKDAEKIRRTETLKSEFFGTTFMLTKELSKDAIEEKQYPVLAFIPLMTALDIFFLPITFPSYLITRAYIAKDIEALKEAINSDNSVTVNKRRFKRIKKILAI